MSPGQCEQHYNNLEVSRYTAQKMKFHIKDYISKRDQIHRLLHFLCSKKPVL